MNVLLHFTCLCGYVEDIGVDPMCGVILEGTVTVICPKCGRITRVERVTTVIPVRFQQMQQRPA